MITGFLTTCPNCKKETQITTKKIKDSTPLGNLPWFERGKCEHCQTPIIIDIDVRVTKTKVDTNPQ